MLHVAAARPAPVRATAMRTSNRDRISPEAQRRAELRENPAALVIQEARRTRACRARAARAAEAGQAAVDRVAREAQADRAAAADQAARAKPSTKRRRGAPSGAPLLKFIEYVGGDSRRPTAPRETSGRARAQNICLERH